MTCRVAAQRNAQFLLEHTNSYWNMMYRMKGEKIDKVQWDDTKNEVRTFVPDWLKRIQSENLSNTRKLISDGKCQKKKKKRSWLKKISNSNLFEYVIDIQ